MKRVLLVVVLAFGLAVACTDDPATNVKLSAAGKQGEAVVKANACAACHSINGDALTGPTWKGLYGSKITLKGGGTVTADAAYIERSIREPNDQRRADANGVMPTFDESRITDAQIAEIVAYIKDVSGS
ncbi:MAG: cytochrome c [Acidimicrobiales bacterium]